MYTLEVVYARQHFSTTPKQLTLVPKRVGIFFQLRGPASLRAGAFTAAAQEEHRLCVTRSAHGTLLLSSLGQRTNAKEDVHDRLANMFWRKDSKNQKVLQYYVEVERRSPEVKTGCGMLAASLSAAQWFDQCLQMFFLPKGSWRHTAMARAAALIFCPTGTYKSSKGGSHFEIWEDALGAETVCPLWNGLKLMQFMSPNFDRPVFWLDAAASPQQADINSIVAQPIPSKLINYSSSHKPLIIVRFCMFVLDLSLRFRMLADFFGCQEWISGVPSLCTGALGSLSWRLGERDGAILRFESWKILKGLSMFWYSFYQFLRFLE